MPALWSAITGYWSRNIGRCARCMRMAFRGAVLAWMATGLFRLAYPDAGPVVVLVAASSVLTALAASHIAAFAARAARAAGRAARGELARVGDYAVLPVRETGAGMPDLSRRRFVAQVLKFAAVAIAASVGLPNRARAACGDCAATFGPGYHDCITYFCNDIGQTCCPPGAPYLNHCDCLCYESTDFNCNSYSNCLYCN